jgi:hypothetical protein
MVAVSRPREPIYNILLLMAGVGREEGLTVSNEDWKHAKALARNRLFELAVDLSGYRGGSDLSLLTITTRAALE